MLDDELDDARRTAAEIATLLHDSASHELNSLDHEIELTAKLASGESPGSELLGKVPAAEILTGGKQLVVVAVRMLATEADVGGTRYGVSCTRSRGPARPEDRCWVTPPAPSP